MLNFKTSKKKDKPINQWRLKHYCYFIVLLLVGLYIIVKLGSTSSSSTYPRTLENVAAEPSVQIQPEEGVEAITLKPVVLEDKNEEGIFEEAEEQDQVVGEEEEGVVQTPAAAVAPGAEKADAHVRCITTKGDFTLSLYRSWAPLGYDRFVELVKVNWFDNQLLYRAIPNFLVQFGIPADKTIYSKVNISLEPIEDDVDLHLPFKKGTLSFAGSGPDSRTYHVFIADTGGSVLGGALHERPFGQILNPEEAAFIDKLYSYGDLANKQGILRSQGNEGLEKDYPLLDKINKCWLL